MASLRSSSPLPLGLCARESRSPSAAAWWDPHPAPSPANSPAWSHLPTRPVAGSQPRPGGAGFASERLYSHSGYPHLPPISLPPSRDPPSSHSDRAPYVSTRGRGHHLAATHRHCTYPCAGPGGSPGCHSDQGTGFRPRRAATSHRCERPHPPGSPPAGHKLSLPSLPGRDAGGAGTGRARRRCRSQFWPPHPCSAAPCGVSRQRPGTSRFAQPASSSSEGQAAAERGSEPSSGAESAAAWWG